MNAPVKHFLDLSVPASPAAPGRAEQVAEIMTFSTPARHQRPVRALGHSRVDLLCGRWVHAHDNKDRAKGACRQSCKAHYIKLH